MKIGELIKPYLELYPKMKSYTLATMICKEHSGLKLHNVRCAINYYRGANGERNRNKLTNREHQRPLTYDTSNTKMEKIQTLRPHQLVLTFGAFGIRTYTCHKSRPTGFALLGQQNGYSKIRFIVQS
jgi:hypothetical protein